MEEQTKEIFLVLEVPPPLNDQYNPVGYGKMRKSREHHEYEKYIRLTCMAKRVKPFTGDVSVRILWYRARKAGDIDGRQKALLDAFQGHAYENDCQVADCHTTRLDTDPKHPRIVVTIKPFQEIMETSLHAELIELHNRNEQGKDQGSR